MNARSDTPKPARASNEKKDTPDLRATIVFSETPYNFGRRIVRSRVLRGSGLPLSAILVI
jgi:hypothetical protein